MKESKPLTDNYVESVIHPTMPILRRLSVVIITQDEEVRTVNAIQSCLNFADEIVVVDGGSRDETVDRAQELGCATFINPWSGYANQRKFGNEKATHDWIFMVDSDEVVSIELATAIQDWKCSPNVDEKIAFEVDRANEFLGRWLPNDTDWQVRLFHRDSFKIKDVLVHEGIDPGQSKQKLSGVLWHYGFRSIHEQVNRFNKYTDLEAQKDYLEGKRFSLLRLVLKPPARFLKRYFQHTLFTRGVPGFAVAMFWSYYDFLREIKLYEIGWNHNQER